MRAVKSVSIDSERRVIITFLDGSTETLYPNSIWCDSEALKEIIKELLEEKADAIVQTINDVAIATFADGADEALIRKLLVSIEPIQEGTGDPSPENVRPISGRTGLTVYMSGSDTANPTEFPVTWETEAGTVYGGSLDVVSGKLTVDYFKYSPLSSYTPSQFTSLGTYTRVAYSGASVKPGVNAYKPYTGVYSHGGYSGQSWASDDPHAFCTDGGVGYFYLPCEASASAIQAYLKSQEDAGTPVTVAYKIATPTEIQLTPQEITTLLGDNNIWADSGNILELEYVADTKLYIGESQSGTLGSGRQTISNTDLQPVTEKTVEDLTEEVKTETAEKETQEETEDERGE